MLKPKIKKTQLKHFTRSEEKRFRKTVEERNSLRDKLMFDLREIGNIVFCISENGIMMTWNNQLPALSNYVYVMDAVHL